MNDDIRACFRDLEDDESPEYSAEKLGLDKRIPKKRWPAGGKKDSKKGIKKSRDTKKSSEGILRS